MEHVTIPKQQFDELTRLITSLPYHAARPLVVLLEQHAKAIKIDEVKDGCAT